ncbi:hypothetical protein A2115_02820 [Candidatus Woesebacteria bacterium GWA1_41_8]|uniref:Uncharacterized protein n=1 Tax=Candidatus Woesebacteria bacterium GWA1_41_8 TaxID=1802471 RepID=A0A1F7WK55_9BACT|nr:MAG: hypothetical protein A2115_02820 [Candidatus Woesebacteria bacterium GWA1_41_8]
MLSKKDINQIDTVFAERLKQDLKPVKSDITKIRKDIDVMLSMFDREYLEIRKRIERIEEHLNLPLLPNQI